MPASPEEYAANPFPWRTNALMFALTVLTTFAAGAVQSISYLAMFQETTQVSADWLFLFPGLAYVLLPLSQWGELFAAGLPFAGTLLAVLLAHEFGHYSLSRYHRVRASLPYFIPMPISFIGTMGAVIRMDGHFHTRNSLMDIGAAGPLAGLVVAIPAMSWALFHSAVIPDSPLYVEEGNSLLFWSLKYLSLGSVPAGHEVVLHPVGIAAWVGFLMTALNLLPIGQLDGGHVTFALSPSRHERLSRGLFFAILAITPVLYALGLAGLQMMFFAGMMWLLAFRRVGMGHPPVSSREPLSRGRRLIGWLCLLLFVLLFTPNPFPS
jgi:membrane-associated protease RseP (regulator of RpoE activity)